MKAWQLEVASFQANKSKKTKTETAKTIFLMLLQIGANNIKGNSSK